jgi:hypothetical protein
MADVIASKKDNIIYNVETDSLSKQILSHLKFLNRTPTRTKLLDFQSVLQTLLGVSINRVAYNEWIKIQLYQLDVQIR